MGRTVLESSRPARRPAKYFRLVLDATGFVASIYLAAFFVGATRVDAEVQSQVQWKPTDSNVPLMLPDTSYSLARTARGSYRIDGPKSAGQVNTITFLFRPAPVNKLVEARENSVRIAGHKFAWRSYKVDENGKLMLKRDAHLENILQREGKGGDAKYLSIQIVADSEEELRKLTALAESILEKGAAKR